jgi:hypothetical protein
MVLSIDPAAAGAVTSANLQYRTLVEVDGGKLILVPKGTKTETVKHVPVHPTLAAMLAEWKLSGWTAMMGRAPEPDDLIIPMPPTTPRNGPRASPMNHIRGPIIIKGLFAFLSIISAVSGVTSSACFGPAITVGCHGITLSFI